MAARAVSLEVKAFDFIHFHILTGKRINRSPSSRVDFGERYVQKIRGVLIP